MYKYISLCISLLCILGCTRKEQVVPCTKPTIQLRISPDTGCASGIIELVNANAAMELLIQSLGKKSKTSITGIPTGKHLLTVLHSGNCSFDTLVEVQSVQPGLQFKSVQEILRTYCASCHSGTNPHAGHDFTNACTILQMAGRIQQRAVLGNPSPMPPSGLIPSKDRDELNRWIEAGAKIR